MDLPEMVEFEQFFQRFYKESYEEIKLNTGQEHFEKGM
jgi:hypothetical protein